MDGIEYYNVRGGPLKKTNYDVPLCSAKIPLTKGKYPIILQKSPFDPAEVQILKIEIKICLIGYGPHCKSSDAATMIYRKVSESVCV